MRACVPHAMWKTTNFLAFLTKLPMRTIIPMLRLTKIVLRRRSSLPRLAPLVAKERGLLAGFGMTKKEREAAAAAKAAQEAQREVPPARIRRAEPVHVPRDLSRPRRASESLSTQLLEGRRPGQAPVPTVDTYWPAEYAFGAADDVVSAVSNAAAGATGVATGMGAAHAAEGVRDALGAAEDEAITQLLGRSPRLPG